MLIRRIGIDFGTSTTVFAYKDYDKKGNTSNSVPKLLELGGRVMFPSIVFEPEGGGTLVYGFDAEEESRIAAGTLYTNFKMDLMSADNHDKACELIVGFLKYLRNIYKEECNRIGVADEEETWLSYPAAWPDQIQLEMQKMAAEAGFVNIHTMDEPTAAINSVLYQYKEQLQNNNLLTIGEATDVLLIDMGAGTTDLVVCRFIPGDKKPVRVLLSWPPADSGDYFGGREMDDRLTEYCIGYCEAHNYYNRDFGRMKNRISRNIKKWKEGECSRALQTGRKPPVPEIVENNVPDVAERNDFEIVDRQSFENILGNLLEVFPKIIIDCSEELKKHGDGFDLFAQTDLVILTGGNSAWYFIDEYLLGRRETKIRNIGFSRLQNQPERMLRMGKPQQTVAYGLTLNEKVINDIVENFKTKDLAAGKQAKGIQPKEIQAKVLDKVNTGKAIWPLKNKSDEIYYKKLKDLGAVACLINEAVIASGDSTKVLSASPMANAIYSAEEGKSISDIGATLDIKIEKTQSGKLASTVTMASSAAVAGAAVLFSPVAILGIGGGLAISKVINNKQMYETKARLLGETNKQLAVIKQIRDFEKDAVEERKKLIGALEKGLEQVAIELQSDLDKKGKA